MKIRHNKKRNTAFVYEALLREGTAAILKEDRNKRDKIINLLKKHFKLGSVLRDDLECYRSLYENQGLDAFTSEKILKEVKTQKYLINDQQLFEQQTALINDVNKILEPHIFSNFVPNYKTLATISQIFSTKVSPKNKIILENQIISNMTKMLTTHPPVNPVDGVLYSTFVQKFNDKYDTELLPEQKELLGYYISSFVDNALELKTFLNEEIARLKIALVAAKKTPEIKGDTSMLEKTTFIEKQLGEYAQKGVSQEVLTTVLKTQQLVKEIFENGSHN